MEITYAIIALTTVISFICFRDARYFDMFKFNAYDVKHSNQWYRFFTYGFLHAGWAHLIINMFVLYSFGGVLEKLMRGYFLERYILYFILLYMGGLLLSIIPAYGKHKNDVYYNSVGASGAVSAVVFASIVVFPLSKVYLFFIPIPIPSPLFGIMYLAYEFYMSRKAKDNIGHDAHFWGAVFGIVYVLILKPDFARMFLNYLNEMI